MADFSGVKRIIRTTRNIFDGKAEQGTLQGQNGAENSSNTVLRSVNSYRIAETATYSIFCDSEYLMYAFLYDKGNFAGRFPDNWSSDFKISASEGQTMRIILKKLNSSAISPDEIANAHVQIEKGAEKTSYVPHLQEIKKVCRGGKTVFSSK